MENSKLGRLNISDWTKTLLLTVVASMLTVIYGYLQNGGDIDFEKVLVAGLSTGIAYILKNITTNDEGKIAKKNKIVPETEIDDNIHS